MKRALLALGVALCGGGLVWSFGLLSGFAYKEHLRALLFANVSLPQPRGPHAVGVMSLELPGSPELALRLWYPADRPANPRPGRDWLSAPTRAPAFANAAVTREPARLPLVLLAPSWFARRDENSLRAAELASQGYAVAAFDDVVHDPPGLTGAEAEDRAASLDFGAKEAYARTRPLSDARAAREARKGVLVLDRLAADAQWGTRLALDRVGFLGFSFGGAAASEAASIDPRIAAVINFDGWVFGDAFRSGVRSPYLVFWSDFPVPYTSPTATQLEIDTMNDYIAFEQRQLRAPDKFGFKIDRTDHLDYCDRLDFPAFSKLWRPTELDRARTRRIIDAYVLEFFDHYLRGRELQLLTAARPPYAEVHPIIER